MVKQPDIPAGPEAADEPAGPAADPLALAAVKAPDAEHMQGPDAEHMLGPDTEHRQGPEAEDTQGPQTEDGTAGPATDPLGLPAATGSATPAAEPPPPPVLLPSAWVPAEPAPPPPVNGSAWPVAWPAAGEPFGSPPAGPVLHLPAGASGPPPAAAGHPPGQHPPGQHPPAPSLRLWLTIAAALLGVAGLVISLLGVATQVLPRRFSAAQQQQIMSWEIGSRWRTWPAGKIFPASVSYQLPWTLFGSNAGLTLSARRAGIAPQSRCATAVDPALARVLGKRGCEAVLRATYADSTGSFVVTVGVAVMRGSGPAARSLPPGHGLAPGVRPVPFPGTLAARFGNHQRQMSGALGYGPYLILYAAGYTDGRRRERVSMNPYADSELKVLGSGLARSLGKVLGALPPVPRCPGAPGC